MKRCLLLILALLALTVGAQAAEVPRELVRAAPEGAEALWEEAGQEGPEGFSAGVRALVGQAADAAGDVLRQRLRGAAAVLLVVALCGAVEGFYQGGGGKNGFFLPMAGALSVTLATAGSLDSLIGLGAETIRQLSVFSKVLLPTLAAATAAAGAVSTAAFHQVATVFFAFQIYCDFSGYSDIAKGTANLFGVKLMTNFKSPYFSTSIKEFWSRWHISLSSWFKDYLYFPLGGSRCSKWRHRLNIMIVFAVSGLWHGAALTFVAWGLLNGLYQVLSDLFQPARKKLLSLLHISDENKGYKVFRILVTFCLTCLAWVLFRANSLSDAMQIYGAIFRIPLSGIHGSLAAFGVSFPTLVLMLLCVLALLAADWFIHNRKLPQKLNNTLVLRYAVYFILIAVMLLFGSYGDGYDPQDFVYFQF